MSEHANDNHASTRMVGVNLENGWRVIERLEMPPQATGGFFSVGYIVERQGNNGILEKGFLKAMDFADAFREGVDTPARLQFLSSCYQNEKMILEHIRDRRLSNTVVAIDSGRIQIEGMSQVEGAVFYLVFPMADGDIRVQRDLKTRREAVWCMSALRDVCLGLYQVHRLMIAHQDAKPSNILVYGDTEFKIADFGRASWKGHAAPYDEASVAGDRYYAPMELLYGQVDQDFLKRRVACDLYMFGNIAAFLFSGINVTADIISRLDPSLHYSVWGGTYGEVLPYVQNAFAQTLHAISEQMEPDLRPLLMPIIRELCNPDPSKRGHPKGIAQNSQFSLERYVSIFDRLAKRVELDERVARRTTMIAS